MRVGGVRELEDFAFREAKRLGYLARSALKLRELQERYALIPRGGSVLDLGCAPGAWLQVACQSLGPAAAGGVVVGVDLKPVDRPRTHCDERVHVLCADARQLPAAALLRMAPRGFSAVLSDMCPNTRGVGDAERSLALAAVAMRIAIGGGDGSAAAAPAGGLLRRNGALLVKVLEGDTEGQAEMVAACRAEFARVAWARPKATRSESREIYLVATGRRRGGGGAGDATDGEQSERGGGA